jgi:tRNA A-37 threonylcarbamoyl transferase component Bud32
MRVMRLMERYILLPISLRAWRARIRGLATSEPPELQHSLALLGLDRTRQRHVMDRIAETSEVVLAEIDQDGLVSSFIGPMAGVHGMTSDSRARRRSRIQLVATNQSLGLRKCYVNRWRFMTELKALYVLRRSGCNVPTILNVDFDNVTITMTYVVGAVLREELALRGAVLRDRDIEALPSFRRLDARELWWACISEGKQVLFNVVTHQFAEDLQREIKKIHAARVIWGDVKYGNIIIEERSGQPWLVDFDYAVHFPFLPSVFFRALCEEELALYRLHFRNGPVVNRMEG